jgi:hypothetical protein
MRACACGCYRGMREDDPGMLCKTCRADLELGRLVRAMPPGSKLHRHDNSWRHYDAGFSDGIKGFTTPEEALRGK